MSLDHDPSSVRSRTTAREVHASLRRSPPTTPDGGTQTDAQLLKAICEGDESGLRAAVAEYGGFVYGMALLILRQSKLAEEVAHDTFVMLWRMPESFNRRDGSLKAFLTEVARNKAIDLVRYERMIRGEESPPAESPRWLETSLPIDTSSHGEDGLKIRRALNGMHRSVKEALFLAYFRGLTYREVSEVLEIREEKAKTRIRDALISLRSSVLR